MYLMLVLALIATGAAGFFAGKEYDRMLKRYYGNVRRREEEQDRRRQQARIQRQQQEDKRKFDFMYGVEFDAPQYR